jgi:hypothetical protein
MNPATTQAVGIFQGDCIIQSAIQEAIADLRRNPWLLDYVFASLAQDPLTQAKYGEKQIELAKRWALSVNIPVTMNISADDANYPCVSIALANSEEVENTLGDVAYEVQEDNDDVWPALYGPFTPLTWDPLTGVLTLPADIIDSLVVAPGQLIVDAGGQSYEILEVQDSTTVVLDTGITAEFNNATIRGSRPSRVTELESCNCREMYSIGVHVADDGNGTKLAWLFSIVKFCLLRYRQAYLEARGFERTSISCTPPRVEMEGENSERYLSRYIQVTGFVREVWPKAINPRFTSVTALAKFQQPDEESTDPVTVVTDIETDLFDTEGDPIGYIP